LCFQRAQDNQKWSPDTQDIVVFILVFLPVSGWLEFLGCLSEISMGQKLPMFFYLFEA
jgi:hypothetical protein